MLKIARRNCKSFVEGGDRVHIKDFLFNEILLEANYISIIENKEIDVIEEKALLSYNRTI